MIHGKSLIFISTNPNFGKWFCRLRTKPYPLFILKLIPNNAVPCIRGKSSPAGIFQNHFRMIKINIPLFVANSFKRQEPCCICIYQGFPKSADDLIGYHWSTCQGLCQLLSWSGHRPHTSGPQLQEYDFRVADWIA